MMNAHMYDSVIIGAGPAGLAAAVYMARQKLSFVVLTGDVGGKTLWSTDVENYLGFHLIDGVGLVQKFREHLADYQQAFELHEGEPAAKVERAKWGFRVTTAKGSYDARTVLVATGEKNRTLDIPGEKELYGRGVTYCAACDAPIFAGKNVHVVGGGNSAMDAALFLEKYAAHITLVSVNPALTGDAVMLKRCMQSPKMTVLLSTKTMRIVGEGSVAGIGLTGPDGVERVDPTEGVFIEVGLVPVADFIDIVAKDKRGQIIVDKYNAASIEGVWAAGDVTDVADKQIAIAVGEGSKAALEIIKYLQKTEFTE